MEVAGYIAGPMCGQKVTNRERNTAALTETANEASFRLGAARGKGGAAPARS